MEPKERSTDRGFETVGLAVMVLTGFVMMLAANVAHQPRTDAIAIVADASPHLKTRAGLIDGDNF